MLRPRLIPCLLVHKGGLAKTIKFENPKYVGDPLNAVRIFNDMKVDELIVLDIDATSEARQPNLNLIAKLAVECRMPLCYGGGITEASQVEKIIGLGVEKVAIGHAALLNPELIKDASIAVGGQSVVAVVDVRRAGLIRKEYRVCSNRGRVVHDVRVEEYVKSVQLLGAGEILLNSVDRDGTQEGYDLELIGRVAPHVKTPITVLGGASSLDDMKTLQRKFGSIGMSAGSLFVFKGKYRAVLIQYPDASTKDALFS